MHWPFSQPVYSLTLLQGTLADLSSSISTCELMDLRASDFNRFPNLCVYQRYKANISDMKFRCSLIPVSLTVIQWNYTNVNVEARAFTVALSSRWNCTRAALATVGLLPFSLYNLRSRGTKSIKLRSLLILKQIADGGIFIGLNRCSRLIFLPRNPPRRVARARPIRFFYLRAAEWLQSCFPIRRWLLN